MADEQLFEEGDKCMNRFKSSLRGVTTPLFILLLLLTACTQNSSSKSVQVTPTASSGFSLRCPHQVALDKQGNIYVTEDATQSSGVRIIKFSPTGQVLALWHPLKSGIANEQGFTPSNVAFDNQGNFYFTEDAENSIMKYSPQGAFLAQLGTSKQTSQPLQAPLGLAINPQGDIYVSDNGYIRTLSPNGNTIAKWDENENNDAGSPVNLSVLDTQGNLYVIDHHYIAKFSPTGKRLQVWNEYPTPPVSLDPFGITVNTKGTIYVADGRNHRILRLASHGTLQSVWNTSKEPKQIFIESVAVDTQGDFYVIDGPNPRQVEKISPQGSVLSTWKANCPDDSSYGGYSGV